MKLRAHMLLTNAKSETAWQKNIPLVMFHFTFPGMWWQVIYKIKRPPGQNFFGGLSLSWAAVKGRKFAPKAQIASQFHVEHRR